MKDYIIAISALNELNVPVTLRFSINGYIDEVGGIKEYKPFINSMAKIQVMPNDGGLLNIFDAPSIGDISLSNRKGGLNYLLDYAIDGRDITISKVNDDYSVTQLFYGKCAKLSVQKREIIISIRAWQEALTVNYPLSVYQGTGDLEGGDDLKDKVKPKIYGDCRNVTPILIDPIKLIYQVSDFDVTDDYVVRSVYIDGQRMNNKLVNGNHFIGDTTISLKSGIGIITAGETVIFPSKTYTKHLVIGDETNGIITISPPLTVDITDNSPIEVVNNYANTTELLAVDWSVNGKHSVGAKSITLKSGTGPILAGDTVMFGSKDFVTYTVSVGITANVIVLEVGLKGELEDGYLVSVKPAVWRSYKGYFRMMFKPVGQVTCDVVLMKTSTAVHGTGDIFEAIALAGGVNDVDNTSITTLNNTGTIGLLIDSTTQCVELLNKIIKSVAGIYWYDGTSLKMQLLAKPSLVASWTLTNEKINDYSLLQLALAKNSLPTGKVIMHYDRIETILSNVGVLVSEWWAERFKSQYRQLQQENTQIQARHLLAETFEFESLLRYVNNAETVIQRLIEPLGGGLLDTNTYFLQVEVKYIPSFYIGQTISIDLYELNYYDRKMLVVGYIKDDYNNTVILYLIG